VAEEMEAAAEVGEMRGMKEAGPATADEGKRREGRGWETGEEI
jgi:hypothetical protein